MAESKSTGKTRVHIPHWLKPARDRYKNFPIPQGNPVQRTFSAGSDDRPGEGGGGVFRAPRSGESGGGVFRSTSHNPSERFRRIHGAAGYPRGVGALGFHPDLPDSRDKCLRSDQQMILKEALAVMHAIGEHAGATSSGTPQKRQTGASNWYLQGRTDLPHAVDLRETGCLSPVEDQGSIGSCTAQAVVGLVEFLLRGSGSENEDFSRMFLYKNSRRILGWSGDTGAYLRSTIKALRLFGVPPESEWPYLRELLDVEPEAYHFAFGQNFKAMTYARFDGYNSDPSTVLEDVKRSIADGFPVAFGFPVYASIASAATDGLIKLPQGPHDRLLGGHAVLAVGYDEDKKSLLIRNSWGAEWGIEGYGYLPYPYVENQWATDFWTVFNKDWLRLETFEDPSH